MARRMFSADIVGSDLFLDMPISSQCLYYHLGMYTDDDGFVNPKRVMRMIGVAENDLDILIAKGFVFRFKSGVVVIIHWRSNNLIRKDWYKETFYLEEKAQLRAIKGRYIFVNELTSPSLTENRIDKENSMQKPTLDEIRDQVARATQ